MRYASLLFVLGTSYGATITLDIPAFVGCSDQFRCVYYGFSGVLNTAQGSEIAFEIGTIIFSGYPTPSPDQHANYSFNYTVNGSPFSTTLFYRPLGVGVMSFQFLFQGAAAGDPRLHFSTSTASTPVDGITAAPVTVRIDDSTVLHAPEPGAFALAGLGLLTMLGLRFRPRQSPSA